MDSNKLFDLFDTGCEFTGKCIVLFFIWPAILIGLVVKAVRR